MNDETVIGSQSAQPSSVTKIKAEGKQLDKMIEVTDCTGISFEEARLKQVEEGFAPVKTDSPIRGTQANDIIVDEVQDENTLWRACRKYCKTKGISQEEARTILINDASLIKEWANK